MRLASLLFALSAFLISGCSSDSPAPQQADSRTAGQTPPSANVPTQQPQTHVASSPGPVLVSETSETIHQPKSIPAQATPDAVVSEFLTALRTGDDAMAELLLTTKAREETAKNDLQVLPPGAPTARFEVGNVQFTPDNQGAWVPCLWTEGAVNGNDESFEITWALRHEPSGWRIAGMATPIAPGQVPLFLNFEDPAEMMAKLDEAQKIARQQNQNEVRQAQQPTNQPTGLR